MRQAEGQAEPDPVSPGPPSAPRRRWGRRRWLVLMLQLLPPLVARVFGWFSPSDAWSRGRSAMGCCWALRALLARGWRAERPCRAGGGWPPGGVATEGATGQHDPWDELERLAADAPAAGWEPAAAQKCRQRQFRELTAR